MTRTIAGFSLLVSLLVVDVLSAQELFTRFRSGPTKIVSAAAYSGEDFGVGRVVFRVGDDPLITQTGAIRISEESKRIIYPAFSEGLNRFFASSSISTGGPGVQTVWFLFRGDEPLDITVSGSGSDSVRVDVEDRPFIGRGVYRQWWRQFNLQLQNQVNAGDYPPLVETYLTSMLSKRLGERIPMITQMADPEKNEFAKTMDLIFDVESVRVQSIREMMENTVEEGPADIPLPMPVEWGVNTIPPVDDGIDIEGLAHHVPEECFYLRFGTWENQVWLKHLLEEYGSDLSQMVARRGYSAKSQTKMLDQLVLESSDIDDLLGGNLVSDMAFIGRDFYINDGPAIGALFESKRGLFETNMRSRRQRYARKNKDQGVTLEEIDVAGHKVTLLSTSDNRIRSFYAVDKNYHLITTSVAIVERFFAAGSGERSLAQNPDFRYARALLPTTREDTVFIYLSSPFFNQLLSPQCQVELARRNRSLANIQLLQMASWAAEAEGYRTDSIDNLQRHGFLPVNFGTQPDGSSISFEGDEWIDSARGRRGYFMPICDVEVPNVTQQEADWLAKRMEFYQNEVQQVDPIVAGIKRYDLGNNIERLVIDARVAPFAGKEWDFVQQFMGPPLEFEVAGAPDDLISLQLSINSLNGGGPPHQFFAAIQGDIPPARNIQPGGFFETIELLKSVPGYIGTWPSMGVLDILPGLGGHPDERGFTHSPFFGLWRMQHGEFSLISFDRDRLERVRPHLTLVPSERSAQMRLRVGDIASSNLRSWLNMVYYQRGWQTSIANVRFLNFLQQQFGVGDAEALEMAEEFLDVKLVCSLGGDYELLESDQGRLLWRSSKWPSFENPHLPDDYQAPPMKWFRGLSADVYMVGGQFVVHSMLDVERNGEETKSILPSFNLFKGFDKIEELPEAEGVPDDLEHAPKHEPESLPDGKLDTELKPPKTDRGK